MVTSLRVSRKRISSENKEEISNQQDQSKNLQDVINNSYFLNKNKNLQFIPSGSNLLDLVLGGGWPIGRMVNIIGDSSTGKSLLAIEACANCKLKFPNTKIYYFEAESAFDKDYAEALGMPIDNIEFPSESLENLTIESWYSHLESVIDNSISEKTESEPILYILDSLDALSDEAELDRKITDSSYGMAKQKKLGELFRRLINKMGKVNLTLIIISQVRANIGVTFGEKLSRSGGKAMDFYASICLWLTQVAKLKKTINGKERIYGVTIKSLCKKNKVSLPYRECQFPIIFGYGIDDFTSCYEWATEGLNKEQLINFHEELNGSTYSTNAGFLKSIDSLTSDEFLIVKNKLIEIVRQTWFVIEQAFLPKQKKYPLV